MSGLGKRRANDFELADCKDCGHLIGSCVRNHVTDDENAGLCAAMAILLGQRKPDRMPPRCRSGPARMGPTSARPWLGLDAAFYALRGWGQHGRGRRCYFCAGVTSVPGTVRTTRLLAVA